MNNKDDKSISEKYAEIMRYANLVIPSNQNQKDLSQPSPLEVVESYTSNNCSDSNLIKMEDY